jgi:hypothetical protein
VQESDEAFAAYRRTQAAILRSRKVLLSALKRDEVAKLELLRTNPDPVGWLENALQIDFPQDSELLRVGLSGKDPATLAVLVNAIVQTYLDEVVNLEQRVRAQRLTELEKSYAEMTDTIKAKKNRARALARELGAEPDPQEVAQLRQQLAERDRELVRVVLARVEAEHRDRKDDLAVARAQEKLLREEMEARQNALARSRRAPVVELEALRDETSTDETLLRRLQAELETRKLEMLPTVRVSLFQEAEAPVRR